MEIHAPSHPLKSLKEFVVHIVIVTIGILIALWFDGIRERSHARQLVREARENVRLDVEQNREHLKAERQNLEATLAQIGKMLQADPAAHDPNQHLTPGFYFYRSTSWDTALSTGALAHMQPTEVVAYAEMHEAVRTYTEIERTAFGIFVEWSALESGKDPSAESIRKQREKLLMLQQYLGIMQHLAGELSETLEAASKAESQHN